MKYVIIVITFLLAACAADQNGSKHQNLDVFGQCSIASDIIGEWTALNTEKFIFNQDCTGSFTNSLGTVEFEYSNFLQYDFMIYAESANGDLNQGDNICNASVNIDDNKEQYLAFNCNSSVVKFFFEKQPGPGCTVDFFCK